MPDCPSASGQDVRPVPSGVAVYDGLVACRLQYQCLPLLRPGRGCAIARTPDAGAPAECGMPRVWCIALRPLYASRNLRRAVVVDEALPAVCWNAAARTYSCSAVRGAVGACVAAGRRGRVSRHGTWGSSCAGQAATGPMVTAATADASAVRSVGLYCRSPVVSRARCLQAAIQATTPQFVQSGSAPPASSLPLCCTLVAVSRGGPRCSASGSCPGGRAGGTGCG